MKQKLVSFALVVCVVLSAILGLTSCDKDTIPTATPDTTTAPKKLSAPAVTLNDNVATWGTDMNADKFEISIDGNLSYVESTVTSKTLTDGQTFRVRAVGDGNTYYTSDWSNTVTYTGTATVPQPTKLGTPTVTISSTGLASWTAVANASGYVYKIGGGAETPTTSTSVQLTDGQSITVKAVGDGTNYTDSDYSAVQTYTANTTLPTDAPTYIGIFASNNEPSSSDGFPEALAVSPMMMSFRMMRSSNYRDFETAIDEYFADSKNHFNGSLPTASDCEIYSRAGETVYVQIWLNNPKQHTILSLELNGMKYQVGGDLSSFFVEKGGQYYNCVYVAVTVPTGSYDTISYKVTKIEYVEGSNINQDGKAVLIDQENDTVTVGLPYNAEKPTVSDFNPTSLTINSCSATFSVSDASGLINLSGGWLGVAVYDGYNVIANRSIAIGNNSISATGLEEGSNYWIIVYLYADLHDGNGVSAHVLLNERLRSTEAIAVDEIKGTLLYDSVKDGYYGAIKVNTTLNSNTAKYIKLEILKGGEVVYTDTSFNGTATVSEGILCGSSYDVRVYYKDNEYPEGKYVEENAWVDSLGTPWYQKAGVYTFVTDAVYYFQIGNGDKNYPAIESFTLKLYNEESARWVAGDVLYILNNPTAIDDLNAQIDALRDDFNAAYGNSELMNELNRQIQELEDLLDPLDYALWYLENRADNNRDKSYWEAEAKKGKYFYEFEYNGTNTDKLFKIGKTYYAVLDDCLGNGFGGMRAQIDFKYDKKDGTGLATEDTNNYLNLDRELTNHWVMMENLSYSDGKLTLTLFNEADWGSDVRPPYAIGYVYKVMVDGEVLYLDNSTHSINIDEQAWLNAYIARVKAGESTDGLMEEFVPDYESSYTIPIDATKLEVGNRNFEVYIRLIATEYEENEDHACRREMVKIYKKLPKPSIEFKVEWGQSLGIVSPDSVLDWSGSYEYEAIDKSGDPVDISLAELGNTFHVPPVGTKVRVKLSASDYWLESEWSEWCTFEGVKLAAPTLGEYSTETCKMGWSADTTNVSHYLYTLNGGTPVRVELNGSRSVVLNNGDVLRVKCVVSEEGVTNGYLDSDWVEYTCIDSRTALATPKNVKLTSGMISWDAVEGASYYIIEYALADGRTMERQVGKLSTGAYSNAISCRVRAVTEDLVNYRPSAWSESIAITGK